MSRFPSINFSILERASDSNLITDATMIRNAMGGNTSLFPEPDPTIAVLTTSIEEFSSASATAKTVRSDATKAARASTRETLLDNLASLGYYAIGVAKGDRNILAQTAFPMPKAPQPRVMDTPGPVKIKEGKQSGEVEVSVDKVFGAQSYDFQYTTDHEMKEESWQEKSCTTTKCTIKGLTPGLKYFFRVRAIGTKGQVICGPVIAKIIS